MNSGVWHKGPNLGEGDGNGRVKVTSLGQGRVLFLRLNRVERRFEIFTSD